MTATFNSLGALGDGVGVAGAAVGEVAGVVVTDGDGAGGLVAR